MHLVDEMITAQNGALLSFIHQYYGLPQKDAKAVITSVALELNEAVMRAATEPNTLIPVLTMMGSGQLAALLDHPASFADPATRQKGLAVLETLLGTNYGRHKLAQQVSEYTSLPSGVVEHMLPTLAAVAISILHRKTAVPIHQLLADINPGFNWALNDRDPFNKMARFIDEKNKRNRKNSKRSPSLRTLLDNLKSRDEAHRPL